MGRRPRLALLRPYTVLGSGTNVRRGGQNKGAVERDPVHVGPLARWKLRRRIRIAVKTGGETGRVARVFYWRGRNYERDGGWNSYYANNAPKFAGCILQALPDNLITGLDDLRAASADSQPFLVVRNLYPTRRLSRYSCTLDRSSPPLIKPTKARWYIENHVYDLTSSTVLHALGTRHRPKIAAESEIMFRDYFTSPELQQDQFTKDVDVPLRFKPLDPELTFSNDTHQEQEDEAYIAPRFVIFVCIENPIKDPLSVLPVKSVYERLDSSDRQLLQEDNFEVFDHWDEKLSDAKGRRRKRLLSSEEGKPWSAQLSFDSNRFNPGAPFTSFPHRRAVADLRRRIDEASRDSAISVTLARGDALVVDNYRAMVRRTEGHHSNVIIWSREPVRWLRLYAGFERVARKGPALGPKNGLIQPETSAG